MSALLLAAAAASVLHVTDAASGCFQHDGGEERLERGPAGYGRGDRVVPMSAIEHLREVLVHSERPLDAAALGITPTTLAAHRAQIVASAHLTSVQAARLDVARVAHVVETGLAHIRGMSTSGVTVDVHLDEGSELAVSSSRNVALMLPWHVTVDGRSWISFDPAVSEAVAALLPRVGTNRQLVRDVGYWRTRWDEPWEDWFAETDARDRGLELARQLPGFQAAARQYVIEDADVSYGELSIELRPRSPWVFDRITWRVDFTLPTFELVTARIDRLETQLGKSAWLARWRAGGMNEASLELGRFRPLLDATELWSDAGLRGIPDARIVVSDHATGMSADLFAGPEEQRAVIWESLNAPGLEVQADAFSPDGTYVVVEPSGTLDRGTWKRALDVLMHSSLTPR